MHHPLPSNCHLSHFPLLLSSFHGCSPLSLCFAYLHPNHEMCQRVNSHTPGLHSTLMLSHDKLLPLSLICNLLLLLFPFFPSLFHTKWTCFAWSCSTVVEDEHISPTLDLTQSLLTSTSVTWEFFQTCEHAENEHSKELGSSCLNLHQSP